MIKIRHSEERGHADHGWLDTRHTFSFADYQNRRYMGFRSLRVINEDRVAPGKGFGLHRHNDMEILTYVLSGELEHRDSLGNGSVIRPGEVQYIAAGTGVEHSEFNPSQTEPVHFMQIWIQPDRQGAAPRYEQRTFPTIGKAGKLTLLASSDGHEGSIQINQDAWVYAATMRAWQGLRYGMSPDRGVWIQVLRGTIEADGKRLGAGDGASVIDQADFEMTAALDADLLVFDLA